MAPAIDGQIVASISYGSHNDLRKLVMTNKESALGTDVTQHCPVHGKVSGRSAAVAARGVHAACRARNGYKEARRPPSKVSASQFATSLITWYTPLARVNRRPLHSLKCGCLRNWRFPHPPFLGWIDFPSRKRLKMALSHHPGKQYWGVR